MVYCNIVTMLSRRQISVHILWILHLSVLLILLGQYTGLNDLTAHEVVLCATHKSCTFKRKDLCILCSYVSDELTLCNVMLNQWQVVHIMKDHSFVFKVKQSKNKCSGLEVIKEIVFTLHLSLSVFVALADLLTYTYCVWYIFINSDLLHHM